MGNKPIVIAHRGASGYKTENTLEAFEEAIRLGADFIELDVQKTCDGEIVVYHDLDFGDGTVITEMSFEAVKKRTLAKGINVPLLAEVITLVNNRVGLDIEIKTKNTVIPVINLVKRFNNSDIIISSFQHDWLRDAQKIFREICFALLVEGHIDDPLALLRMMKTSIIVQNFKFVDSKQVDLLHQHHKKIFVWTVNHTSDIKKMIDISVDGIITDFPDKIKAIE